MLKLKLKMNKILIEKYLKNKCSQEELDSVLSWLGDSTFTYDVKDILYRVWAELPSDDSGKMTDFDALLAKVHHKINIRESEELLEKADYNLIRFRRKEYVIKFFRNAAALLIFPILGAGLFLCAKYYTSRSVQKMTSLAYNEVFSSVDAITRITLPDGSVAWLNHRSSLRYPAIFEGNSRHVELEGEGYFEAAHNEKIPFVVNAGDILVVAHGTTFNVMAYPDENKIETSLISGSVELRRSLPSGKTETFYKMNPRDLSVYDKDNKQLATRSVNDERYYCWKDGKLIFTKEPLEEVVRKLGRWFNVDIKIEDPKLCDLTLTATFINETLPQVMELLAQVIPVDYSISERNKIDTDTFSKRTVILKYKK